MTGRGSVFSSMRGDVPGVEWPPLFSGRVAPLAAAIQQLEATQWLPPEAVAAAQRRQLRLLADHFAKSSEVFRARLARSSISASALREPGGLQALSPLTRQEVQSTEHPIFVDALPPGHAPKQKVATSGSTGEPVVVYRTPVNQVYWLAMTMRYHFWAEPDLDGRICAVRAELKRVGEEKDWGPPANLFFKTGPGLKIDIEVDIRRQIEMIRSFGPTSLVIYPSNLVAIMDELVVAGLELPTVQRVRTIGEMLQPGVRQRVGEVLGATLHDCYSSQEVGYIALQCPQSDLYHVMSETVIVEVVDDEGRPTPEGQAGRILVTDLHNHATPLIRYAIGDYAEPGPPCPCGRGLPTLKRILGRERNLIVKPDGTRHWPLLWEKPFREIVPIVQYQMRQLALDRIEMRMVVERPLSDAEETAFRAALHEVLRYPYQLDFVYFEGRLPTGPNGKFEEFLSLI